MALGPVIVDIEGTHLTEADRQLLQHPLVGGLIYFARNFESANQIAQLSASIKALRPELLIAVDQEGGRVQRFKEGFTRLPAMQQFLPLYRKNADAALSLVQDCGWLMAAELLSVGVDFSFAPVLDVDDSHCEVIANRSFSPVAEEATALASAFMKGMNEAGMATTGKHFPGHGSVSGDSHKVLPRDSRSLAEIEEKDLVPFKALIDTVDALMPAHIIFEKIDPNQPVGFSSHWLQTILRQKMGFQGVIFSDDLTMEGAAIAGGYGERAQAALDAGCDIALICNNRQGAEEALAHLENHYSISEEQSQHLQKMASRQTYHFDMLKGDERYMRARAILNVMSSGK